jgi:hypothetical protein
VSNYKKSMQDMKMFGLCQHWEVGCVEVRPRYVEAGDLSELWEVRFSGEGGKGCCGGHS